MNKVLFYLNSSHQIATMCHTKLSQSTFEEMQHIVHHDKATAHQITDPHELDPSKKMQNTTFPL
jgi:hypothetical protein